MFIDSHCHLDKLDLSKFDLDEQFTTENNSGFERLLSLTAQRKIAKMLCVNIDLATFASMYQKIAGYPQIDASVGVHPLHVKTETDIATAAQLITLAKDHEKVVAIGETGLDFFYDKESKEIQRLSFIEHLKAAAHLALPVIVHTRDARAPTIDLIGEYGAGNAGVLHCFTETLEMAQQAIELGYLISISGIVTFKNSAALQEVVRSLPLEHLLIETDSPYLAPIPYRGQQNQPKYVVEVAQCIADLKGLSLEKVAAITTENYYRLFNRSQPC